MVKAQKPERGIDCGRGTEITDNSEKRQFTIFTDTEGLTQMNGQEDYRHPWYKTSPHHA